MKYGAIKYFDIANGPGARTCLFVSGCRHKCKGCFNFEAWDFNFGDEFTQDTEEEILKSLAPSYISGLSVLGGDPMEPENQRGLVDFLEKVRKTYPEKSIWMYTGDIYEDLKDHTYSRRTEVTDRILNSLDVLVDGPWMEDLYDITLRFRGSSNQRLIDIKKTREKGEVVLWEDEPIYATHHLD